MNRLWCIAGFLLAGTVAMAQEKMKPAATEDWQHKPPVVTPGRNNTAPSDAIVLFAGKTDVAKWQPVDTTAFGWEVRGKTLRIRKNGKDIQTVQSFGSIQLHIEWRTPDPKEDAGSSRGNSGVYFMGLYELQIYESYQYATKLYYNGVAGSVYKQFAPLVNACLPPRTWQTFDVVFEAPVFDETKTLVTPAFMTVFHNGVLIQNHVALKGPMTYAGIPAYTYHEAKRPLRLQEHDSRVEFRNIWVREL